MLHKSELNNFLIEYDFFGSGYDLCQQATYNVDTNPNGCKIDKTIEIACEFQSLSAADENDYLSINISAPITGNTECENKIVLDLSNAEFTADGLVFSSSSIDIFASDFEFKVTKDGFTDAKDGSELTFDSDQVDLEDVYSKIIELRTT